MSKFSILSLDKFIGKNSRSRTVTNVIKNFFHFQLGDMDKKLEMITQVLNSLAQNKQLSIRGTPEGNV